MLSLVRNIGIVALLLGLSACIGSVGGTTTPPQGAPAPTLTIVSPTNNQILSSATITVLGTASPQATSLSYRINAGTRQSTIASTSFSFQVNLTEGNNIIEVFGRNGDSAEGMAQVVVNYQPSGTNPPGNSGVTNLVEVTGATSTLKINEPLTLTAVAKDANNNALSGKTFTWASSDPNIATVSSSGVVTARRIGSVTISASVDGKTWNSSSIRTYGLEFTGGVGSIILADRGVPETNVFVLVYAKLRDENGNRPSSNVTVTVRGPAGWNRDIPVGITLNPSQAVNFNAGEFAISGLYTATTTVSGVSYSSSFTLDSSRRLPEITSLNASSLTVVSATLSWNAISGAAHYSVFSAFNQNSFFDLSNSGIGTTNSSAQLNFGPAQGSSVWFSVNALSSSPDDLANRPLPDFINLSGRKISVGLPRFSLAPSYGNSSNVYFGGQRSTTLQYLNITNRQNFTTQAQNFTSLSATSSNPNLIGSGPTQINVIFRAADSSADSLAFVLVVGSQVPVGDYPITLTATGNGVSASTQAMVRVVVCSSGCN